jgi:hypothetical protein
LYFIPCLFFLRKNRKKFKAGGFLFEGLDGDAGYLGRQIFGLSDSWMATPELKTGDWELGSGLRAGNSTRPKVH